MDREENIVEVKNVSMRFNLSKEKVDNLKEYVVKFFKRQLLFDEFYALRNVSFTVKRGEPFAIVGENGCGKSTLLKVISGIFYPTRGSVTVRGSVAPLIELGAGFDMDLTARENIYLNGAVLGYSTAFMDSKFQEIMDFAELWEFVDVPVKNFSSGMVARLGFSIATVVVPDILIVDEILSVGDFMFQQKCERKMQEMIDRGATLIFVSHSADQVKKLCRKAIWLKHGVVQMIGDAAQVSDAYHRDMEEGGRGLVTQEQAAQAEQEGRETPFFTAPPLEGSSQPETPPSLEEPTAPSQQDSIPEPVPAPADIPPDAAAAPTAVKRFAFLSWLRLVAMGMIVWDHLGPFRAPDWWLGQLVENNLNRPLQIVQSFGGFGVVLFFLISGFLLAHGDRRGGGLAMLGHKLWRLYPPLLASFATFFVFQKLVSLLTGPTWWEQFTPRQWLLSGTLGCYLVGEPDVINGTTWFLFPLILFYLLAAVVWPWLAKRPPAALVGMEALLTALCCAGRIPGVPGLVANVAAQSWYVAFPLCGMLLYYLWSGRLRAWQFLGLGGWLWLLLVKAVAAYKPDYYEQSPYLVSFVYGLLLFAVALLLEEKLKSHPAVAWMGRLSYQVYLVHMPYGSLFLTLLAPRLGYTLAFGATLVLVLGVAWVHYRWIEGPLARLRKKNGGKNHA